MKIEQKTISLELAQKIAKAAKMLFSEKSIELPESEWFWIEDQRDYKWGVFNDYQK